MQLDISQENKRKEIILSNILYLAQRENKPESSKRNVLNKWFQDAIKSYIMESVASSLIADPLRLHSSAEVRNFINNQTNKNKAKYMAVIEQYFFYINKFNKQDLFTKKLKQIIYSPVDITQQNNEHNYNTLKLVRKQFVCFLILNYFELYGQQEIASFYELWNICFPEQQQTKKKLSKYDQKIKIVTKRQKRNKIIQNDSSLISSNLLSQSDCLSLKSLNCLQTQENFTNSFCLEDHLNLNQSQLRLSVQESGNSESNSQRFNQPINNKIFEEQETHDIDNLSYFLQIDNNYTQCQEKDQSANQSYLQQFNMDQYQNQQQLYQSYEDFNQHYQQNYDNNLYYNNYNSQRYFQQQNNEEYIKQVSHEYQSEYFF
ncbi:hypothetical protein ABPG73_022955 [Tetrahymena malaccensis]